MARDGLRRVTWMMVWLGAGGFLAGGGFSRADAVEKEKRIFTVKIDGKQSGTYEMAIRCVDDRTFVDCRANVSTSYLFIRYKYTYQGTEVWKNGRLVYLKSRTNDDGTQYDVQAEADQDTLRVQVNGKVCSLRGDVWTTSYWRAPEPKQQNQAVALLDCDTGKELPGTLQYLGKEQLTLAGQTQNCAHYRLTGGVQVNVWYDAQQRLIRQDALDDGHRVVLELARIER
jgi:hypothetical protein